MFFAPDEHADEINNCVGYCLGLVLRNTGVQLHAAVVMSNHIHIDVTDPHAQRPRFNQQFNSLLARGINALRGRSGTFWDGAGTCDTRQPTGEETVDDLVYTLTNPVKAALVKRGERWPGFSTCGWRFGEARRFYRPRWFFDPDNEDLPETVEVRLTRPDILPDLSDDDVYTLLMDKIRARELEIQRDLRLQGRRFMGERKIGRQRWQRAPRSPEDRFGRRPTVASSNKWLRIAQLQRDREWERKYAEARARHRANESATFPLGTYWMRLHMGVKVANAPP